MATDSTTDMKTLTEQAAAIGREDRQSYRDEFGIDPVIDEVGDWDATGVTEMWCAVTRQTDFEATSPEGQEAYQAARLAYLKSLFDTEDVA
jgi:hypothetical protein